MRTLTTLACIALVASILVLAGCSQRQQDWESARAADTAAAYDQFLAKYPQGEFSAQAAARAKELRESEDWQKALAANTAAAYAEFLRQHPSGRMSDDARIRIESFALDAQGDASAAVPAIPDAVTPQAAPAPAPERTPAASVAKPAPAGAGPNTYRVQLGAFSGGEKQAMGEWRKLQREYPKLLAGLTPSVRLATTTSGHLYRLQAGTTDEATARAICAKLKADDRACVVVLP